MPQRSALNRPGTATHPKGQVRLIGILEAARQVFMNDGYANFTMRKVAARAGISVGNLNYYYRSKEDLLRDMLDYVISHYVEEFENRRRQAGRSAEKQLEAIAEFIVEDLSRTTTTVFFPELWALANHDAYAAALMEELYVKGRQPFNDLIPLINPDIPKREREEMALFMSAAIEGLTMFVGNAKPWADNIDGIKKIVSRAFLGLIRDYPAAKGGH